MFNGLAIEGNNLSGVAVVDGVGVCSQAFIDYLKSVDMNKICDGEDFTMIKDGTTTTVGVLDCKRFGMDFNVVLKRFNYRGFIDAFIKKIFGSRARRLYLKTIELSKRGVSVPEPLAFIEGRDGKSSLFISRHMEGYDNMAILFKDLTLVREDSELLMRSVAKAIAKLHLARVCHGDMKWSNILAVKDGGGFNIVFVDNDQARIRKSISDSDIAEDIVRFYRYGLELKRESLVVDEFFKVYLPLISDKLNTKGLQGGVISRAVDEFSRKK